MWNFRGRAELEQYFAQNGIDKNEACLIGGLSLQLLGLREHNDLDAAVTSTVYARLKEQYGSKTYHVELIPFTVNDEEGDIKKDRYLPLGFGDDDIVRNEAYHTVYDGFKVIKPELSMAIRLYDVICRPHDKKARRDVVLLEHYAMDCPEWDWTLVVDPIPSFCLPTMSDSCHKIAPFVNIRRIDKSGMQERFLNIFGFPVYTILREVTYSERRFMGICFYTSKRVDGITKRRFLGIRLPYRKREKRTPERQHSPFDFDVTYRITPVANFLNMQRVNVEFQAYDIIVRLLAIENYFNKNNYGMNLYEKMQQKRGFYDSHNMNNFRVLIDNIQNRGFDLTSSVTGLPEGILFDGSHRLACCLYFDVPYISLRIQSERCFFRDYGLDWFQQNGFSSEEIETIIRRKEELFFAAGLYFPVILWSPVKYYYGAVTDMVAAEGFRIVDKRLLTFKSDELFKSFIFAVYASDDIDAWKVARKHAFMRKFGKEAFVVWVEMPEPKFRKKSMNNHLISTVVERLKAKIRHAYQERVDGYVYDIICHIGDNFSQNAVMNKVIRHG